MQKAKLDEFLESLKELETRLDKKKKIQEHITKLRAEFLFAKKMELPDYKMVDIYQPLVNQLSAENALLFEMQNEEMLEDIEQLLELNQAYIKKTKEQFDEIESLRSKLAKQKPVQNNKEMQETTKKLQARNKRVKELNDKVDWLQKKRQNSRELSQKEQKLLKFYNTPKQYCLDSKKWYVKFLGILFRK